MKSHTKLLAFATLILVGCDQANDSSVTTTPYSDSALDTTGTLMSESTRATSQLVAIGGSEVKGTVSFTQDGDVVKIHGEVTGLKPGKHGFHVHEKGDLSDTETGESAGGHYNPTDQPHGKMNDAKRHVGDLGNIEADQDGKAVIDMEDSVISLSGEHSIIGRAIVIHAGADQYTQPAGEAGDRVAFGKIEKQSE